ncbi:hypothetical protein BCR39DRAFT_560236 [Naematelia encephala]|uniref:5-formyltetrahydrofolate cyclo-ligase n=1 Tax=Naematelia encephala TaxID=71784 RepID=A0A1Y2AXM1_9TREE|nr:hypothetical protein BCR39DRAFT_560236 [Naematelia encephala]
MANPFALKTALRKSMLRTLRSMSVEDIEKQSQVVAERLFALPVYQNAKSIGCYLSMAHGELRTTAIVTSILSREKKLYTPYIPSTPEQDMKMLRLYSPDDLDNCPLDKWGILDPGETRRDRDGARRENVLDKAVPALDLILIPGVAFDEECNRLGRGKAFYDRFLASYTTSKGSPVLLALALEPQMLPPQERVPITQTDFRLHGVISPSRVQMRSD